MRGVCGFCCCFCSCCLLVYFLFVCFLAFQIVTMPCPVFCTLGKSQKKSVNTPPPPSKTKQTKNNLNGGQSHERDSMVTKGDFFLKSFRNFVVSLYLN